MMISEKMHKALNTQVMNELHASHIYLAMSLAFRDMGLKVFAGRFYEQSEEERRHALKIINYLQDVGAPARLDVIPRPEGRFETATAIIKAAVQAEEMVTKQVNELVTLAETDKDYATRSFLQWFVDEQVEEVASMHELLQWVEMAGEKNLFFVEARVRRRSRVSEGGSSVNEPLGCGHQACATMADRRRAGSPSLMGGSGGKKAVGSRPRCAAPNCHSVSSSPRQGVAATTVTACYGPPLLTCYLPGSARIPR